MVAQEMIVIFDDVPYVVLCFSRYVITCGLVSGFSWRPYVFSNLANRFNWHVGFYNTGFVYVFSRSPWSKCCYFLRFWFCVQRGRRGFRTRQARPPRTQEAWHDTVRIARFTDDVTVITRAFFASSKSLHLSWLRVLIFSKIMLGNSVESLTTVILPEPTRAVLHQFLPWALQNVDAVTPESIKREILDDIHFLPTILASCGQPWK